MAVITLTTDWRNSDYYVGAVKGKIVSKQHDVPIIDVSHQIGAFNVMQAAFVIKNCYAEFPEGSVHIIGVNAILNKKKALLIIEKNKHFFLCSDTGFPDLLFPEEEKKVYAYILEKDAENTFVGLDYYTDVAVKIIQGHKPADIAGLTDHYVKQIPILPTIDENLINGSVVYIDSYANAITNVNREVFNRVGKGQDFEIFVQSNHYRTNKISKTYSDMPTGELVAIFNSVGLLEIAIVNGPAAELLNLNINSVIRIKFSSKKESNELQLSGF